MGGKCAHCGSKIDLTFDCIKPMGHDHHGWSTDKRMTFYRQQARLCNLQILCAHCNSRKQAFANPPYLTGLPGGGSNVCLYPTKKNDQKFEPELISEESSLEDPF